MNAVRWLIFAVIFFIIWNLFAIIVFEPVAAMILPPDKYMSIPYRAIFNFFLSLAATILIMIKLKKVIFNFRRKGQ